MRQRRTRSDVVTAAATTPNLSHAAIVLGMLGQRRRHNVHRYLRKHGVVSVTTLPCGVRCVTVRR
ncbi:MAG TPA: hypothetical protein VHQ87_10300 [Rhizobacter sp.]|nr:hypothetical protein [Rhizobacter sp.]